MVRGMFLVAMARPKARGDARGDGTEAEAWSLAEAVGSSLYEARTRLRVLDDGAGVIASFAAAHEADALAHALRSRGFVAWCMSGDHHEPRVLVRNVLGEDARLVLTTDEGGAFEVSTTDVRLLLRGSRFSTEMIARPPSLHALERPGGLITRFLPDPTPTPRTRSHALAFLHVYALGWPTFVLTRDDLHYAMRPAMQPTRTANFAQVVEDVRRVCVHARYDDRLCTRAGQARILGPALRPERHLDVAIALVAGEGTGGSPYR